MSFVVAIDGPAGSGKGTITKIIAKNMGLVCVDTGAMYRSITLYMIRNKLSIGIPLTNIKLKVTDYSRVSTDSLKQKNSLKTTHIFSMLYS